MTDKIILITNLNWVEINDIRLEAHAILLEPPSPDSDRRARVRGFTSCGTSPVFDVRTADFEHALHLRLGGREEEVRFGSGLVVKLVRHDYARALDVEGFEPDESNEVYENIWNLLETKVAQYWPSQQFMPRTVWGPPRR